MLKLTEKLPPTVNPTQPPLPLTLSYERRILSRLRVTLDNGQEAGLFLTRGTTLKQGDLLQAETGELVIIQAAAETVSTVYSNDPLLFARCCYHLGNRHVPLEISAGRLRYLHDHVLDEMVQGLGVTVATEQAPFEPESGAYSGSHTHQTQNTLPFVSFPHAKP